MSLATKLSALFGTGGSSIDDGLLSVNAFLPPGTGPIPYAGTSVPTGWMFCYGQPISRTLYANLFAAIGTTYGVGDGSSTFNLPDMRGRVAAGMDNMGGSAASRLTTAGSGVDGSTLGASGGAETHTLTVAQMPSHTHTGAAASLVSSPAAGSSAYVGVGSQNTGSQGSGAAHNNTQPTLVLNYIIKT